MNPEVKEEFAALHAKLDKILAALATTPSRAHSSSGGGDTADDSDLDGQHGDPVVRKMPSAKYWSNGGDFTGRPMSQCPAEFLDALAKYKDACAYANLKEGLPEKAKYADYDKRDAKRARGWARRIRESGGPVAPPAANEAIRYGDGAGVALEPDELPF